MITLSACKAGTGNLFQCLEWGASPSKFCISLMNVEMFDNLFQKVDKSRRALATASVLFGDIALVSLLGAKSSNYYRVSVYSMHTDDLNTASSCE